MPRVNAANTAPLCDSSDSLKPYLIIRTQAGLIEIELFERAAPRVIGRLAELVRGPIFNERLIGANSVGYYDGLTFNYTKPHLEITTSERMPKGVIQLETEINAEALGLHQQRVKDAGDAMTVMQRELLKAHVKTKKRGKRSPKLEQWLRQWYGTYSPDFLIGVSRKEINEALGYVYTDGLESRPVTKGTVALKPISPRLASPRLSIILQDMPHRTGKWMIIGRVVVGLDLADQISTSPLITPRHVKPLYIPFNPVVIESAQFSCRP